MRMWARNTGRAALVAAGAVAVGAAFGSGAVADTTSGNFSVLGGNQVQIPISVPVEASGNAVGAIGAAQAQSKGGAEVDGARRGGGDGMETSGNFSIGGGNQVKAPVSLPVDVCGNAIAIIGLAKAQCKGGASVKSGGGSHHREGSGYRSATGQENRGGWAGARGGGGGGMETSGNFSILGGNQVYAPISIPVNVCGNSVAVLGLAKAQCKGGASVKRKATGDPKMKTSGNFSILGGNQVYAPISIPVNVCGNAIAVLGLAQAQCKGGATVGGGEKPKPLPPTLRTPKYKPSKHRPAAGKKKLPSTLRSQGQQAESAAASRARQAQSAAASKAKQAQTATSRYRMARPAAAPANDYRKADKLPAVQRFLGSLKKTVDVPGVDVKPGQIGPKLSTKDGVPVKVGSPVLN
ncbi:chaplin [Actinomadura sp. KC06]|uniref:chaplin n=1 Tax=Actinomadura sp. KC06 TaxID=2530369 RepID=UPI00104BFA83|nr:chaplin [Actinomadura sp. KC06]TDD27452.1 chaplin [Actinomadura sp. KC06]